MVVENPVTVVLYNQFPFVRPYRTLNVFIPAYGPQLREILVGLILLESIMIGTVVIGDAMQFPPPVEEEDDPEDVPEVELDEEDEPELGVGVDVGVAAHV